jgi:uncharacterized protein YcfJ
MKLSNKILSSMLLVATMSLQSIASEMPNSYTYVSEVVTVTKSIPITIIESQDNVREECTTNRIWVAGHTERETRMVKNQDSLGGGLIGAGIGGLIGNQFGGGSGKKWATGIGAVAGYGIGSDRGYRQEERYVQKPGYYTDQINCVNVSTPEKVKVTKYKNIGKSQNGKIVNSITEFPESTIDIMKTETYDGPGY